MATAERGTGEIKWVDQLFVKRDTNREISLLKAKVTDDPLIVEEKPYLD